MFDFGLAGFASENTLRSLLRRHLMLQKRIRLTSPQRGDGGPNHALCLSQRFQCGGHRISFIRQTSHASYLTPRVLAKDI